MTGHRRLGRTGLIVPEYTIGTAALNADPGEAHAMLALALESGLTALELGAGDTQAAALLGEALRRDGARDAQIFARVTSLVPFELPSPHVPAPQAYPGAHIRAETEALLKVLGVERLALQQLHAWCPEWLDEGDWLETFDRLREEGKIAGFGVSLFDHDLDSAFEAVASGLIDSVQVMVNLFDQGAAAALLPLCREHDVAVIARSPLYYGALAGSVPAFDDWRHDYFYPEHRRETDARAQKLAAEVGPGGTLADLALRFVLSDPAVSTVAVGTSTRAHLEANLAAFAKGPLPAEKRAALAGHAWLC
ncbi:MAG: aldo/keto reductase [Pseudomonadota bacterium]